MGRFCGPFGEKSTKSVIFRGQIWKVGGKTVMSLLSNMTQFKQYTRRCLLEAD